MKGLKLDHAFLKGLVTSKGIQHLHMIIPKRGIKLLHSIKMKFAEFSWLCKIEKVKESNLNKQHVKNLHPPQHTHTCSSILYSPGSTSWLREVSSMILHSPWFCLFPGGSDGKESACSAELGSIPRSGRSPGEGNSKPLQYSCLENSMDRGVW